MVLLVLAGVCFKCGHLAGVLPTMANTGSRSFLHSGIRAGPEMLVVPFQNWLAHSTALPLIGPASHSMCLRSVPAADCFSPLRAAQRRTGPRYAYAGYSHRITLP